MQDQEQEENKMDVITVDVPLFIRLLEFAREDATDDMMLHDVAEKLIEMCADGDIMQMEQYDEIVGSKEQVDTSGMNAVEDNMHPQNKDMDTINEQRWLKLAGINENEVKESKKGEEIILNIARSLPDDATLDDLETALRENGINNAGIVGYSPRMLAYPYATPNLYIYEYTDEKGKAYADSNSNYEKINNILYAY
jgi:hypothetical protein